MKYHALFVILEKVAKFEIVVCCKLLVALYGLMCMCSEPVRLEAIFYLLPFFVCMSGEGSSDVAHLCRLVCA